LEKHGYKSIDKLYDDIFDLYIEPYFIKNNNDNSNSQSGTASALRRTSTDDEKKDPRIIIDNNDNKFVKVSNGNNYFSLYSGTNCENINFVENWSPKNYSCVMKKSENIQVKYFKNNKIKLKNTDCEINKKGYQVKDKLLSDLEEDINAVQTYDELYVLEVEFILRNNPENSNFGSCIINLVVWNENIDDTYIFKNSVIFTNNEKDPYVPYRYSGNIGYLNGYPLKISVYSNKRELTAYNDFYIIGKNSEGTCRTDINKIFDYLYFSDKPILFNEDYTYSCKISNDDSLEDTTLYQKIKIIEYVAKYGSSDYNKIEGNEDWIKVSKTNFENTYDKKKNYNIEMNIKYKTDKQKGFYSHKIISEVSIKVNKKDECDNNCYVRLEIKYTGDEESNESKYNKVPDIPFFIPDIPDDILDPFINPDVDKWFIL